MVKETVINCIEAPVLKGVSKRHFIDFRGRRESSGRQIKAKRRQLKESIIHMSFKASIEDEDLEKILAAEWIKAQSTPDITELQLNSVWKEGALEKLAGKNYTWWIMQ